MLVTAKILDRPLKQVLLHLTYESFHSTPAKHWGHMESRKMDCQHQPLPRRAPEDSIGCSEMAWCPDAQSGWMSFLG